MTIRLEYKVGEIGNRVWIEVGEGKVELDVAVVRVRMGKDALIPLNSKHISEISQSNRDTWKLTRGNRPELPTHTPALLCPNEQSIHGSMR